MVWCSVNYYLVAVPANWLMTRLGHSSGLVLRRNKRQIKSEKKLLTAFDHYSPTAHDVFVNTFAKSGTNWMMQIAHQIAFLGDGEFENIHDVVTWPEMHIKMGGRATIALDDTLVQQASPVRLRVIKTHLAAQYVPYSEQAMYVTVIRDPKDVFVSSYHFMAGNYGRVMPSVEDWLDAFLGDNFPIGFGASWAEHTASYWALRDKPNVLLFSFKAMKSDLPGTVKQVAELLNVPLTEAQLDKVVNKSTFDYMKAIDHKFFPIQKEALPWMKVSMVRQGAEGVSKELLSAEQQRRIDSHFIEELKSLGSDFPYGEFCRIAG